MAETNPPAPEQPAGATTAKPAKAAPKRGTRTLARPALDKLPPYNVVLLDDDHHTYEYVIEMIVALFGYDPQKAFAMAQEVDAKGRVIVLTTHKEKAELKRDQITAYGADARSENSAGSMSAVIEPAME